MTDVIILRQFHSGGKNQRKAEVYICEHSLGTHFGHLYDEILEQYPINKVVQQFGAFFFEDAEGKLICTLSIDDEPHTKEYVVTDWTGKETEFAHVVGRNTASDTFEHLTCSWFGVHKVEELKDEGVQIVDRTDDTLYVASIDNPDPTDFQRMYAVQPIKL